MQYYDKENENSSDNLKFRANSTVTYTLLQETIANLACIVSP